LSLYSTEDKYTETKDTHTGFLYRFFSTAESCAT
jgi:hypothetical protein